MVFGGSLVGDGKSEFFCGFWWEFAGSLVGIQCTEEPKRGNLSGHVEHSRKTTCWHDG